jgi:hypothetical protein
MFFFKKYNSNNNERGKMKKLIKTSFSIFAAFA